MYLFHTTMEPTQTQNLPTIIEGFSTACYEKLRNKLRPKPVYSLLPIIDNH